VKRVLKPFAVSWGPNHVDVFWRGTDGALWHRWFWQGKWNGPESLGSEPLGSAPVPVSWGPNHVDVFWRGTYGALWHRWFWQGKWNGPESLGSEPLGSAPVPVSWGPDHVDVFWRGTDGALWHRWFWQGNWNGPESLARKPSRWAILLCKFTDVPIEPIDDRAFCEQVLTGAGSGSFNLVDYFRDVSHGNLDLSDSRVFGWIALGRNRGEYAGSGSNPAGRDQLLQWAKQAAVAAGVDLNDFFNVVICTNTFVDFFGGPGGAVTDTKIRPSTLAQEMGHAYGLAHSSMDGSSAEYKDPWDVMSANNSWMTAHPQYELIGPGLNAWNMRGRGWLDESRVWKANANIYDETVELRPLFHYALPGFIAAELAGEFLIEFRTRDGWDAGIPRPAILVHRFDNNISFIMKGTAGQQDLEESDLFEATVGGRLAQVQVISIEPEAQVATIRLTWQS